MTERGFCQFVMRACATSLAAVALALAGGCGSPSDTRTDRRPDAPVAATQTAAVEPNDSDDGSQAADAPSNAAPSDAPKGAKLSGRVVLNGTPPERRPINMSKDAKCVALHGDKPVLDEALLVGDGGGMKNVFVYVRRGAPKRDYPLPEEPARLDQNGCMYRPRVQGVRVGQRLLVGNGDPVTHNVRSFPVLNRAFNFGQPPDSEPRERVFERAEREVEVQCDFHPWMHAYIFVMEHPFFSVTADDGTYAIDGLPPGEYSLEAWHEKLGRQRQTVTVAQRDLDVDFSFRP